MEDIKLVIERLREEIGSLKISVALLQQSCERIEKTLDDARNERTRIASEVGTYGIQITKFVSELSNLSASVSELKPTVSMLQTERVVLTRAGQFASLLGKAMWAIIGIIIGLVAALSAFLGVKHVP